MTRSRHNDSDAGKLSDENIDDVNLYFPFYAHSPLISNLSKKQAETIRQIRSVAVSQDQIDHCERILEILDWLLDDEQKVALAGHPLNYFYLFASVYLNQLNHNADSRIVFGFLEYSHAQIISKIIRACRQPEKKWQHTRCPAGSDKSVTVSIELVSAVMALAGRLDLNYPRTLERICQLAGTNSRPVAKRWPEEFQIVSCGPHPRRPGTVLIRIECRNIQLHRTLKHYEIEVERFLNRLNKAIRPRFLYSKVNFEIYPRGYEPLDFKFTVDSSAALHLFMGNTLYGDKRVFLRELIQNAVDACHLRSLLQPNYKPFIAVNLNAAEDRIIIKDNGIGMDRDWVEKYFLNVGVSFYRSGELDAFSKNPASHIDFISNFGIGFLSTFLVADRITVRTRKPGAEALLMTINDVGDYFDVRKGTEQTPIGTEIVLELNSSRLRVWRSMEFLGYLKSTARFTSIPIHFTDANGHTTVIGCKPLDSFSSNILGQNFSAALKITPSQGYLLIQTRGAHDRIFGLDKASGGISIFQDGIFVTQMSDLLPEKARSHVIGRLNLRGKHKCELSMDRNRIFWPQQFVRLLRRAILHAIADAAGQMLEEATRRSVASGVRIKIEHTIASFFEFTTVDDALFESLHPSVQQLLQRHFRSFLRTSISKTDRAGRDLPTIAAGQGFQYEWQREVIAGMAQ